MTARERVFVLVSVLVAGFVYSVVEGKRQKPPFDVADATYVDGEHARIGVMATEDFAGEALLALCKVIASDADVLIEALGIVTKNPAGAQVKPAVFVMPQQGLDRTIIERASLSGHEGIVLRAAPDVAEPMLRAEVLHELVSDASLGRALREDRHVLLDGFAAQLAMRADPSARELSWLRFASLPKPVDERLLTRWEETMEQLGQCRHDALAFAVVETLRAQLGEQRLHALLRSLFGKPPKDVRVLLERAPADQLAAAGITWSQLAQRVEEKRQLVRTQRAAELAAIPVRSARIAATRSAKRGVSVQAHVRGAVAYRVLYTALGAWASVASPLARLDVRGASDAQEVTGTVPLSLARGSRVFAAVEVEEPVLQCPLRLRAERLVVP